MHMHSLPLKKQKLKDRHTVGDRQQIGIPQEEKCWLMCQFTAVFAEERSEIERERERMTHNLVWFLMTVLKNKADCEIYHMVGVISQLAQ